MDWNVISAVAEVTAAVAVVISLIYIAIQVRGNSELLERTIQSNKTQSAQSVIENFDGWRRLILETGSEDIWFRGVNDLASLDRAEKLRFTYLASTFIWTCWSYYQLNQNEGLIADVNEHIFRDMYKHPGFREWMQVQRRFHSDEFGEFLDTVQEAVGDERYRMGEPSSLIPVSH